MNTFHETIICTLYVTLISLFGCALFLYVWPFSSVHVKEQWLLLLLFASSAVLLSRYVIYLPPNGNAFTLESSVYLSLLFIYSLHFMTTKPLGTGLGLTIVKRIIENHGGTIALHDSSEKGTTFVISLPIGRKEE